jgi:hypothetical protein
MYPTDPVNLVPIPPLIDSYIYHSEPYLAGPSSGSENESTSVVKEEDGWIMGIDEAGRGRTFLAYYMETELMVFSGDRSYGICGCLLPEIICAHARSYGI